MARAPGFSSGVRYSPPSSDQAYEVLHKQSSPPFTYKQVQRYQCESPVEVFVSIDSSFRLDDVDGHNQGRWA